MPGTPPHAWGRQRIPLAPARPGRYTPTRVGTTPASTARSRAAAVHPHTRGDDYCVFAAFFSLAVHPHTRGDDRTHGNERIRPAGSPPHAWGTSDVREMDSPAAGSPHTRGDDGRGTPTRHPLRYTPTRGDDSQLTPRTRGAGTPHTRVGTTLTKCPWQGSSVTIIGV